MIIVTTMGLTDGPFAKLRLSQPTCDIICRIGQDLIDPKTYDWGLWVDDQTWRQFQVRTGLVA